MNRVLITGGSQGLGRALAEEYAQAGAQVFVVARNRAVLDEALSDFQRRGLPVSGAAFDVRAKDDIHRIVGLAQATIGPINGVFHNASTLGPVPMPELVDLACESFEAVLQTNLLGPFRLTKALGGSLALEATREPQAGPPTVAFISSDAALSAYPGWGAYGVSKAAQDHLVRSFASEVPGVRFVAIDPGEMRTAMHRAALPDTDEATLTPPAAVARWIRRTLEGPIESGARLIAQPDGIQ